jgi:diguanylate cyclase (GGDEF)-like protein
MVREQDLVARYGGEEFAVLLPETTAAAARKIAERIRDAIVSLNEPHARSCVAPHLTISVGVATGTPADDDDQAERLLAHADKALYRSKEAGRNRVTQAP